MMKPRPPKHVFLMLCLCLTATMPAAAQKAPELGYVYPPTLSPGATHAVELGGFDFTGDMQFFVHDEQVELQINGKPGRFFVPEPPFWFGSKGHSGAMPIPREVSATLTIAKDHPPGLVRWQVANANGSSPTAVFYVSDTPEVVESRYRNESQFLESLPIGVSGRLSKIAEIDRYSFEAKQDGPVTIELFARTLGANFNGVLEVRDASDTIITDTADTEGLDTALTFAAKSGQQYTVHLHDVDFRGNRAYVYRLAITPGPRVVATVPAVGEWGTTRDVEFIGIGVATGKTRLESTTRRVTFPPSGNTDVLRYRLETPYGQSAPYEIRLGDLSEQLRLDHDGKPHRLQASAAVTGRLTNSPAEFVWTASKGEIFQVEALSRAMGGRLDLALEIMDADRKSLASNDDSPGSVDPSLTFEAPADGDYICQVSDLAGRSGQIDSIYRLSIARHEASYSLTVPQQLNINVGGTAKLPVAVQRTGGHQAAIPIRLEGLPDGVTAPPADKLVVPEGQSNLEIELQGAEQSAAVATSIRVVGQIDGEAAVIAQAPAAGNLCPRTTAANQLDQILLTTTLTPAFSVELVDKNRQRAVHRGTTYPAPFIIRRDEGFDGDIALQMLAKQSRHRQGVDGPILPVPAGATEVLYPCYMPEWLETDRTTRMVVLGVGWQKDPLGNIREVTKQADARITMILEGALLQVAHELNELTVNAGETFEVPFVVSRSAKLPVPVKLQMITPVELRPFIRLEPESIDLSPNETQGKLRVITSKHPAVVGRWPLTIKATALQDGRWLVVAQTELSVQFNNAAASAAND